LKKLKRLTANFPGAPASCRRIFDPNVASGRQDAGAPGRQWRRQVHGELAVHPVELLISFSPFGPDGKAPSRKTARTE